MHASNGFGVLGTIIHSLIVHLGCLLHVCCARSCRLAEVGDFTKHQGNWEAGCESGAPDSAICMQKCFLKIHSCEELGSIL